MNSGKAVSLDLSLLFYDLLLIFICINPSHLVYFLRVVIIIR